MTSKAEELLSMALKLSPEARAALAGSLLDSLEESVDPEAEELWASELARRIEGIDSGKVELLPWSEARGLITGRE